MSGTVRSAEQARDQLGHDAERVHVIDSASACGGRDWCCSRPRRAAREGADAAAVAERARRAREAS